jgi:hypothetical protein
MSRDILRLRNHFLLKIAIPLLLLAACNTATGQCSIFTNSIHDSYLNNPYTTSQMIAPNITLSDNVKKSSITKNITTLGIWIT